ncbi:MAG: winged helix-turn-helix transcriptional regulator, partial [Thermoplasmata archaeon]
GLNETYYRINNGPTKMLSIDGHPIITTENDNNTLEYWSIDNASYEEPHHFLYNIKLDRTLPSTGDDYDGLWHASDFMIILTAFDDTSGINETYYRINGGSLKTLSIDGHPIITTENDNNTLEYWSVDNASNEEPHKFLYNIKLDKTQPSTTDDYNNLWHYSDITINLTASDGLSGLNDTFYRINNGDVKSIISDGQPLITTEGENNTLDYWSVDVAGNIEEHNFVYRIKLNKTYPDLTLSSEDIVFSEPRLIEGSQVFINVTIHNIGNLSAFATVKFYDGDPSAGILIGEISLFVEDQDSTLASILWTPILGDYIIHVMIDDSIPQEPFTGNNAANKSVIVEARPVLVLSVGELNIFRFESGEERTVPVYVSCYNNSAMNVRLVVLDDKGLNITVVTPPQNIPRDESFTFYLRITAPVLMEDQDYREEDILLQVVSDEVSSNEESMDILVGRAAAELFWWIILIGGAATGAGTVAFLGGTEVGKYALFAAGMSLYTRLKREDILDQETRGMIRGYIMANPGEHYNAIKRALGLTNGTLAYHLKTLEKEDLIASARDGRYKRFYPPGMKVPDGVVILNKGQELIMGQIIDNPGISQKELSDIVGLSTSTINYHISVMANAGFIRVERKGKQTMCYPENGAF